MNETVHPRHLLPDVRQRFGTYWVKTMPLVRNIQTTFLHLLTTFLHSLVFFHQLVNLSVILALPVSILTSHLLLNFSFSYSSTSFHVSTSRLLHGQRNFPVSYAASMRRMWRMVVRLFAHGFTLLCVLFLFQKWFKLFFYSNNISLVVSLIFFNLNDCILG